MKPLHIFLLTYALFITALADGLGAAFMAIPYIGFPLAIAISLSINITMGAGLLFALVANDMFHPKWGPAGVVASFIPGINVLPFWIGLVIAGILHQTEKGKGGAAGSVAKILSTVNPASLTNPINALKTARTIGNTISEARSEKTIEGEAPQRRPVEVAPFRIKKDITPRTLPRVANDNQPYAQVA